VDSDYDYWQKFSEDAKAYNKEKKKLADLIADRLDKRFPGFTKNIEAVDVVTPISVKHWTAAYRGCCVPYPAPKEIAEEVTKNGVSKTLPGLQGFHMVGQWAAGMNGLATVCLMGRNLVRQLCKKDHKKFATNTAD
jgi:phytoene dehydrogenase-like protein